MKKDSEIVAKVIILGDTSVGKSSIILRYFDNTFEEYLPNTIGAAFQTKNIESDDKKKTLRLNVWDTCGQERFMAIASVYYKDANIILLVVDASNPDSLEVADKYFIEIQNHSNADPIVFLVINKIDLLDGFSINCKIDANLFKTCNFYGRITKFIDKYGIDHVFWTSAKENGLNINQMFDFISKSILNDNFRIKTNQEQNQQNVIGLSYINPQVKSKNCC